MASLQAAAERELGAEGQVEVMMKGELSMMRAQTMKKLAEMRRTGVELELERAIPKGQ